MSRLPPTHPPQFLLSSPQAQAHDQIAYFISFHLPIAFCQTHVVFCSPTPNEVPMFWRPPLIVAPPQKGGGYQPLRVGSCSFPFNFCPYFLRVHTLECGLCTIYARPDHGSVATQERVANRKEIHIVWIACECVSEVIQSTPFYDLSPCFLQRTY
jgi:hypothetical protein